MRALSYFAVFVVLAGTAWAGVPDGKPDASLPDSSRWSSFARIVNGRWDSRAKTLRANAAGARAQYWNCVNDAWFIAYTPMLRGSQAPCADLARSAHGTEDNGATPAAILERFRLQFATSSAGSDYSGFTDCAATALDYHDQALFDVCALALRPRERVLATLNDEERFTTWMGACKRILLADVQPVEAVSGEGMKAPRKALTEFERTEGRHCFRTLPAFYEVRGMKNLSDYWTPEERKLLYLRSKQLGQ